jgi:tetratricopeptide (TPR) repeat protein
LSQRAKLSSLAGREDEAKRLQARAALTPLQSSSDHYLVAAEHIASGQFNDAVPLLVEATNRDPQDFWAWFLLGVCRDQMSSSREAVACYSTCIALAPRSPWAWLNRGLAHLRLQNHQQAAVDLDKAIELRPKLAEAYRNRALARQGLRKYAHADLLPSGRGAAAGGRSGRSEARPRGRLPPRARGRNGLAVSRLRAHERGTRSRPRRL